MKRLTVIFILINLTMVMILPIFAQSGSLQDPDCPVESAVLLGKITDAGNGNPIGFVNILLEQANRSITSDADGKFTLTHMRCGEFTLRTFRIGYKNISMPVTLVHNDTTHMTIKLKESMLMTQDVTVEVARAGNGSSLHSTPILVSDKKLHQNLGKTIAETVDYEPGISQRTMGPAPSRPVLRGLSGDRLLLLEDSETTGDLSATSADHAVVIEPMTAQRIEVVRGPEALIYGANALGGVINVVRGYVPTSQPDHITGSVSMQGETVNRGYSGGGDMTIPLGLLTAHLDGSIRTADDINTPAGRLLNTNIHTLNGSAGISTVQKWGVAGVALGYYDSNYGIPPDPYGGHPSGVDINMERYHTESKLELYPHRHWLQSMQLVHTWSRYYHEEIEATGDLGMNFGVVTHQITGQARLGNYNSLQNGRIGFKTAYRDYATGGLTFTPTTKEYSGAMYMYQEARFGKILSHASLRYDYKKVEPEESRWSRHVGLIRSRTFQDVSGAVSFHYQLGHWIFGNTLLRTFRAPGVEELFSEGPHLAAYAYEVGNADLKAENGLGIELFTQYQIESGNIYLAVYENRIDNYLIPVNTGQKSWRRADLYVYRYLGQDVIMRGVELSAQRKLFDHFSITATAAYVRAELTDQHTPVPRIPPLEGKLDFSYRKGGFSAGTTLRAADKQSRLGEFETETDGYCTFDLHLQYTFSGYGVLHSVSASLVNTGDTEYRKHLNRVKQVMPEPGRNFKILYKVFY